MTALHWPPAEPGWVSVIVPCRNEARYIDTFCTSALAQQLPAGWQLELLVADGQSDDGTRERLQSLAAADARLRWVDNPGRIVSCGLNAALQQSRGEVIVRMDVHTEYAPDYIAQCLAVLAETGADNVGGPWHAVPEPGAGPMQQAVAAAFQSRWVAGGARSRDLGFDGWVDTVYLGCWPRRVLAQHGGFDESLVRNQDDEHNLRLTRAGARVWQSSRIRSTYRPRARLAQVFRQYQQYGYWKPFVMRKHGQAAALRQLVPGLFVAALGLALLAWPLAGSGLLLGLLTLYAAAVAAMTGAVAASSDLDRAAVARVPAVIAAYHLGYGLGSLQGWWAVLRGRGPRDRFARLTR
ncbi:glycosyltransferase family 2 protein [Ideonella alba]|uniref:Glycosyltransferase family 2 protein n=1 Tax=Ideonella alba TaxID=2824118 RepID=A0A940Y6E9_9BURK|nr:glycosyltransferase family 2 protein [Ideonella alba]MBQ0929623.1 glycosyltransferase family 2 protein [Ideonella alba]